MFGFQFIRQKCSNTWFDAGHAAGAVAEAFLLFAFAIFIGRTFSQAFLAL